MAEVMRNWIKAQFFAISILALATGSAAPSLGDPPATPPGKPARTPATYDLKIAGYAKGNGAGQYNASKLSLSGTVEDENGNTGELAANDLTIDANSHFEGTGTVLGKTMTISGRLDDPSSGDTQLKARRVVATFKTTDGHYGRIAGFVSKNGKPKDD